MCSTASHQTDVEQAINLLIEQVYNDRQSELLRPLRVEDGRTVIFQNAFGSIQVTALQPITKDQWMIQIVDERLTQLDLLKR